MVIRCERVVAVVDRLSVVADVVSSADKSTAPAKAALEVVYQPNLGRSPEPIAEASVGRVLERVRDFVLEASSRSAADVQVTFERDGGCEAILRRTQYHDCDLVVLPHPLLDRVYERVALQVMRRCSSAVLLAKRSSSSGRILAATDFSDPALPAIDAAWQIAKSRHCRLTTLHAIPSRLESLIGSMPITLFDAPTPAVFSNQEAAMEAIRDAHARLGIARDAEPLVSQSQPVSSILHAAADMRAELIVVGKHRKGWLERVMLGSVSEAVARRAPCSVLVVPLGSWS